MSHPLADEAALLSGCRGGNMPAFDELYRTHGRKMKSLAYNLLGNVSDAEDVVQETFLKIHRGLANFKGESSFATWCYRILMNNCYDLRRKKMRRQEDQPGPLGGAQVAKQEVDASLILAQHAEPREQIEGDRSDCREENVAHSASTMTAAPCPPPMQAEPSPNRFFSRRSACSK